MQTVTLKTGGTISISPDALPIEVDECGCCGHYHLKPLTGVYYQDDCRFDANRYDWSELDAMFGEGNWIEVPIDEQDD
jgi:hypothetical protein